MRQGLQRFLRLRALPEPGRMERAAAPGRAWRALASWYMWRVVKPPGGMTPGGGRPAE